MIKQLYLPLIGVAAFIVFVGLLTKNPSKFNLLTTSNTATIKEVKIKDQTVKATLANTPDSRKKGLSGVTSLNQDEGMLFVFDQKDTEPYFWMKDMTLSIDIIWINDGKIAKIDRNIAAPLKGTPTTALTLYKPGMPIDYVLEVNSGFSDKHSLKVGDETQFDL